MSNANLCESQHELANWISLSEAAARLPSPRFGKRTHKSTVLRLVRRHGLEIRRRDMYAFVYWPAIVELLKPERERVPRVIERTGMARRTLLEQKRIEDGLRRHGVI